MKKILLGLGLFFLVLSFAVVLSLYLFFLDPVDKEAEAFFFEDQKIVADEDNAYFAFLGFFAPAEVDDIHAYGLKHWNDFVVRLQESAGSKTELNLSDFYIDYSISISEEDSDAVGHLEIDYYDCKEKNKTGCINEELVQQLVDRNSVFIGRLKQLHNYKEYHSKVPGFKLQEMINLAKLQAMQVRMYLSQGRPEKAYKILYENIEFFQNMLTNGVTIIDLAIFKVARAIYWQQMAGLVQDHPEFALSKYSELEKLFDSSLQVPFAEVAKAEFYLVNSAFCRGVQGYGAAEVNCLRNIKWWFIKPNAILTGYYRFSKEFIELASVHPAIIEFESKELNAKYNSETGTLRGWVKRKTTFGRLLNPSSLNAGSLLYIIALGGSRGKSLLAYLELYKNKVKPEDVNDYIANHLDGFYDPLSRKHFVYDEEKGLLMMHQDGFPPEILGAQIPNSLKYH